VLYLGVSGLIPVLKFTQESLSILDGQKYLKCPLAFALVMFGQQKSALARPPPQTVLAAPYRWNYAHTYTLPHAHAQHQLERSYLLALGRA
jgi:hypothetical protein